MYSSNFEERKAVAEKVRTAAHEIGFFYAINHMRKSPKAKLRSSTNGNQGVDSKYSKNTFEQAKRFFDFPTEKKMEVFTGLVPNEYVGYHPLEHYSRSGRKKIGRYLSQSSHNPLHLTPVRFMRSIQLGIRRKIRSPNVRSQRVLNQHLVSRRTRFQRNTVRAPRPNAIFITTNDTNLRSGPPSARRRL
jgi:hypothetical protein